MLCISVVILLLIKTFTINHFSLLFLTINYMISNGIHSNGLVVLKGLVLSTGLMSGTFFTGFVSMST